MIRCAEAPLAASIITSSSISASLGVIPWAGVRGGRLDEEDVGAADRLLVAAVDLAVGERPEVDLAEVDVELAGDPRGELHRGAPAEDHQALRVVLRDRADGLRALLEDAHRRVLGRSLFARARLPLRVSLDVALLVGRDPEGAVRDVLADHRAGASVSAVADADRSDERGVDRDSRTFPDLRPVLVPAVVVGGDRAGAEVGPGRRRRRRRRRRGAGPWRPRRSASS